MIATLTFLTPWGALLALTAAVPLAALALAARRERQARELLALRPPGTARRWARPASAAAVLGLLGLAAAQPVLRSTTSLRVRSDSEAIYVIDISRSMLAARTPHAEQRIARARAAAIRLRQQLAEVPSGVAALTDHVLPYLLPVPDAGTFERTVARAVAVDQPPPASSAVTATNLGALGALETQNFYSPGARHRVAVVITDGESRPFDEQATAQALARGPGATPIFIRVGSTAESVFDGEKPESGYHPDPSAAVALNSLARAAGGKVFDEGHLRAAAHAIRSALGPGPVRSEGIAITTRALAPYLAVAAVAPLLYLVAGGLLRRRRRARRGTTARAATTAASSRPAQPAQS